MADEIPGILPGPFPDGLFGWRGVRRNRGIIEAQAERILGDDEARAVLEDLGQLSTVEVMVDQGMRAIQRGEQRPVMAALAQIVDGLGLFERDRFEADKLDQAVNESLAAAAGFLGPEQREELAQLADQQARAWERAQYQPSEGMEEMRAVSGKALDITRQAGDRLQADFIQPLNDLKFSVAQTRQQLLDSSGGNMDANATKAEVAQVLQLVGSNPGEAGFGGLNVSIPFIGGFTPNDLPSMTYSELLNVLHSTEKGAEDFVNSELEARGAPVIAAAETRLQPTRRTDRLAASKAVNEALETAYEAAGTERDIGIGSGGTARDAVANWVNSLPAGTELDLENARAISPDGQVYRAPPSARALIDQQRRRRRSRRVND